MNRYRTIDDCYRICVILDLVVENLESLPFETSESLKLLENGEQILNIIANFTESCTTNMTNVSTAYNNLLDSDIKTNEYKSTDWRSSDQFNDINNSLRISKNSEVYKSCKEKSESGEDAKPILDDKEQKISQAAIEGQINSANKTEKYMAQMASSFKTMASSNSNGVVMKTLRMYADSYDIPKETEVVDSTNLKDFHKTLNELMREDYKQIGQNIIFTGALIALGMSGIKLASSVCTLVKSKRAEKIKEDKEIFERCKLNMISKVKYLMNLSEKIMTNKINRYVNTAGDCGWWISVMDKIGLNNSPAVLYQIYKIRYKIESSNVDYRDFIRLYSKKYIKGEDDSMFMLPSDIIFDNEILMCINDTYIFSKSEIYCKDDLISYSQYNRMKTILIFRIIYNFYEIGITDGESMILRIQFDDKKVNIDDFILGEYNNLEIVGIHGRDGEFTEIGIINFYGCLEYYNKKGLIPGYILEHYIKFQQMTECRDNIY